MIKQTETEWTATDFAPDLRRQRAQVMTAHVMHAIGKFITDEENMCHERATRALLELFYDNGVDIITDAMRAEAGLSARGPKGWTKDELHIMEAKRVLALLGQIPPMIIPRNSVREPS